MRIKKWLKWFVINIKKRCMGAPIDYDYCGFGGCKKPIGSPKEFMWHLRKDHGVW